MAVGNRGEALLTRRPITDSSYEITAFKENIRGIIDGVLFFDERGSFARRRNQCVDGTPEGASCFVGLRSDAMGLVVRSVGPFPSE